MRESTEIILTKHHSVQLRKHSLLYQVIQTVLLYFSLSDLIISVTEHTESDEDETYTSSSHRNTTEQESYTHLRHYKNTTDIYCIRRPNNACILGDLGYFITITMTPNPWIQRMLLVGWGYQNHPIQNTCIFFFLQIF